MVFFEKLEHRQNKKHDISFDGKFSKVSSHKLEDPPNIKMGC